MRILKPEVVVMKTIRQFFAQSGLLPILFSTVLAIGLITARIFYSRHITFVFLVWNLFLAWIPYLAALWAAGIHRRHPRRWWAIFAPGILWLAFFPNAPYIITDFLHLAPRPPVPMWYDVGMLATFAWAGLFLAVFSLWIMQRLVKDYLGAAMSWVFVLFVVGISGLGVYVGRFLRWNSWDLLVQPKTVLFDIATRLAHPFSNPGTFGVSILFSVFLLMCYLTLTVIPSNTAQQR